VAVIELLGRVNVPEETSKPLLAVISPEAVIVPALMFPKLPVIVGELIVGLLIVGEDIVGELAKTKLPVPVEPETKADVIDCHSFVPFEGLVSTVLATGEV
jgi:hypothetical protein